MSKNRLLILASALILVALVLLVVGLGGDVNWLWQAGLAVLALAMTLSLASRWAQQESQSGESPG